MAAEKRVVVAEDSDVFLEGLMAMLRAYPQLAVVGCVTHKAHLRNRVLSDAPDLIVVDYELADGSVMELLEDGSIPPASCVVLTAYPSEALEARLKEIGVAGFFDKADLGPFFTWMDRFTRAGRVNEAS